MGLCMCCSKTEPMKNLCTISYIYFSTHILKQMVVMTVPLPHNGIFIYLVLFAAYLMTGQLTT
jgi:hypothetical protein